MSSLWFRTKPVCFPLGQLHQPSAQLVVAVFSAREVAYNWLSPIPVGPVQRSTLTALLASLSIFPALSSNTFPEMELWPQVYSRQRESTFSLLSFVLDESHRIWQRILCI